MKIKALAFSIGVASIMAWGLHAQEETSDAAPAPAPPPTRFQYAGSDDPLKRLQEIAAANEAILRKQAACLSELAVVAEQAKAGKASAAKSSR